MCPSEKCVRVCGGGGGCLKFHVSSLLTFHRLFPPHEYKQHSPNKPLGSGKLLITPYLFISSMLSVIENVLLPSVNGIHILTSLAGPSLLLHRICIWARCYQSLKQHIASWMSKGGIIINSYYLTIKCFEYIWKELFHYEKAFLRVHFDLELKIGKEKLWVIKFYSY